MNKDFNYDSTFHELCTERDMHTLKFAGGWVGVDLDGTLAEYHGWVAPNVIGPPITEMQNKVIGMIRCGVDVRIFTARGSMGEEDKSIAYPAIEKWCQTFLGKVLPITNVKDVRMVRLYDDRAFQVRSNKGTVVLDTE